MWRGNNNFMYVHTCRLISKISRDVWGGTITWSLPKRLYCICFQPLQRANFYCRKSPGLFLSGLFESAWDTPYHTIKTGTFKQVKRSQLWWNPPHDLSGQRQGDKFILIQSPSPNVTPTSPADKDMTSRYKLKKRDQRCLSWAGQKYHSEVKVALQAFVQVTNCHFWYVLLNIIGWEVLHKGIFFILQHLQLYFMYTPQAYAEY